MAKGKPFDWGLPEFGVKFTSVCLLDTLNHDHLIMFASATIMSNGKELSGTSSSWGVIYGYAYEGHCYDLPKPKLMLLPSRPSFYRRTMQAIMKSGKRAIEYGSWTSWTNAWKSK